MSRTQRNFLLFLSLFQSVLGRLIYGSWRKCVKEILATGTEEDLEIGTEEDLEIGTEEDLETGTEEDSLSDTREKRRKSLGETNWKPETLGLSMNKGNNE